MHLLLLESGPPRIQRPKKIKSQILFSHISTQPWCNSFWLTASLAKSDETQDPFSLLDKRQRPKRKPKEKYILKITPKLLPRDPQVLFKQVDRRPNTNLTTASANDFQPQLHRQLTPGDTAVCKCPWWPPTVCAQPGFPPLRQKTGTERDPPPWIKTWESTEGLF